MTETADKPIRAAALVADTLRAKLEPRGPRSIQGLADSLGRERTYVHRRLHRKAELGLDDALKLAELLDVDLGPLLARRARRKRIKVDTVR